MTQTRPETTQFLEPGLRRVLAPNPSPMTYWGTNTYIIGEGSVAVIDPGPVSRIHLEAIKSALKPGETVSHILVTHSHLDHSPLAALLAHETGAKVMAFGDSRAGRSAAMQRLSLHEDIGGGEGVDSDFQPHETLVDGAEIIGEGWSVRAIWTPGHFSNHLCFAWKDAVFTGDHVMGWASSLVSPPDGDLTAFMASTKKLAARSDRIFYPGHGAPITDPKARIGWLIGHREKREATILAALSDKTRNVPDLTAEVYHNTPETLLPAAQRNLFAHLIDLTERGMVQALPTLSFTADFTRL